MNNNMIKPTDMPKFLLIYDDGNLSSATLMDINDEELQRYREYTTKTNDTNKFNEQVNNTIDTMIGRIKKKINEVYTYPKTEYAEGYVNACKAAIHMMLEYKE